MSRPNPVGRPTDYSENIAIKICALIADGKSLRTIAKKNGMPHPGTIIRWLAKHEIFRVQYAYAREIQEEVLFSEIVDIADTPRKGIKTVTKANGMVEKHTGDMVDRSRLMIDARKWYLSKVRPRKYGDRLELAGDKDNPVEVNLSAKESLEARIAGIAARIGTSRGDVTPDRDGS
jgi:hypothetical protein